MLGHLVNFLLISVEHRGNIFKTWSPPASRPKDIQNLDFWFKLSQVLKRFHLVLLRVDVSRQEVKGLSERHDGHFRHEVGHNHHARAEVDLTDVIQKTANQKLEQRFLNYHLSFR